MDGNPPKVINQQGFLIANNWGLGVLGCTTGGLYHLVNDPDINGALRSQSVARSFWPVN
jgi:hypothetical protein